MSEFRVNTDIIRNGASIVSKAANGVSAIASRVNGLGNQIGGEYQGQLRDKVRPILSGLSSQGAQLQSRSEGVVADLSGKASGIDVVMQSSSLSAGSSFTSNVFSPITRFFNGVSQLGLGSVAAILGWIGLSHHTTVIPPAPGPTPTPPAPITPVVPKDYAGFSAKVPANDNRRTLSETANPIRNTDAVALYPRGDDPNASNCTWYAAAAVEKAHGVPLNSGTYGTTGKFSASLGNGGEWADHAHAAIDPNNPLHSTYKQYQPYISAVDHNPMAGTIYSTPGTTTNPAGHVMFVEQAQLVDSNGKKNWQITVSEEIWGGKDLYKGAQAVPIPGHPEVKRWTRTITIPADSNGIAQSDGRFIHFVGTKQ